MEREKTHTLFVWYGSLLENMKCKRIENEKDRQTTHLCVYVDDIIWFFAWK